MERVVLMEVTAREMGKNNGSIRAGARSLAKALGCTHTTVVRAINALRKAGLLVLTNTPSRNAKAAAESEWLIPWLKDQRKDAQPTPFTAYWNKVRKGDDTYAKLGHDVLSSGAWKALKPPAKVLLVSLIYYSKRRNDIEVSNAQAGGFIGASADTGRRALNHLERHGFLRRRVQGQSLAGTRITATFSCDLFHRLKGREQAEARFRSWTPGNDFEAPVSVANVRRADAPKVVKPAKPETPPAPDPVAETTETTDIDTEEDIDMADPHNIRTAERLLKDLHHRQIDATMEKFPMQADGLHIAILEAADMFGEARAVAMVRRAAYLMIGRPKAGPAMLRANLHILKREEERETSIVAESAAAAVGT
jgi:CTP-dependent riboflavin kinase